ncbi:MAG: hypothetical protein V4502_01735 [Pseudomonadota bacterium]
MSAAAPARKLPREQSEVARLMTEMGSTKGFDPMPPDQYLYFLGKAEPPLQRLLALVRSLTIRVGHWSPYCVDEHGKELRLADLQRLLDIDHGNFQRAVREAKARGLVRIGSNDAGSNRTGHNSRHPYRVYLCGSVAESTVYNGGEEKGGVSADTEQKAKPAWLRLSLAQRARVLEWPLETQVRFYIQIAAAVEPIFAAYEIVQANKKEVSAPTRVSADTKGVSAPTPNRVSAPTPASLLGLDSQTDGKNTPPPASTGAAKSDAAEVAVAAVFQREFAAEAERLGKITGIPDVLIRKLCARALRRGVDTTTAAAVFVRVHLAALEKQGIRDGTAFLIHAFEEALEMHSSQKSKGAAS